MNVKDYFDCRYIVSDTLNVSESTVFEALETLEQAKEFVAGHPEKDSLVIAKSDVLHDNGELFTDAEIEDFVKSNVARHMGSFPDMHLQLTNTVR